MEKKEMGWPFWDKIAPIPLPKVSVSNINGYLKSGKTDIGASMMATSRVSKVFGLSEINENHFFEVSQLMDLA